MNNNQNTASATSTSTCNSCSAATGFCLSCDAKRIAWLRGALTPAQRELADRATTAHAPDASFAASKAARMDTRRQCADIVRQHITVEMISETMARKM
jgi:hypothetical protein